MVADDRHERGERQKGLVSEGAGDYGRMRAFLGDREFKSPLGHREWVAFPQVSGLRERNQPPIRRSDTYLIPTGSRSRFRTPDQGRETGRRGALVARQND